MHHRRRYVWFAVLSLSMLLLKLAGSKDELLSAIMLSPRSAGVGPVGFNISPLGWSQKAVPKTDWVWALQMHVTACDRPDQLSELLDQLQGADYPPNMNLGLWLHVDVCENARVEAIARDFRWVGAPPNKRKLGLGYHYDIRSDSTTRKVGEQGQWYSIFTHMGKKAKINALAAVLSDEMTVSSQFPQWLNDLVQTHWTPADGPANSALVGINLAPAQATAWRAADRTNGSVYMSSAFSEAAPVFWTPIAQPFLVYANERTRYTSAGDGGSMTEAEAASHDARLTPALFAGVEYGKNAWKQRMDEFMFGNGLVMMYPNFPNASAYGVPRGTARETLRQARSSRREYQSLAASKGVETFGHDGKPTTRPHLTFVGKQFVSDLPRQYAVLKGVWYPGSRPNNCILDDIVEFPHIARGPDKFLVFEPQYGLNNQLLAYDHARGAAALLDRILVLPPLMVPRASDPDALRVRFSSVFEVDGTSAIDWEHFKRNSTPARSRIEAEELRGYDALARSLGSEYGDLPSVRIAPRIKKEALVDWFGQCDDDVLLFDGMFSQFALGNYPVLNPSLNAEVLTMYKNVRKAMLHRLPFDREYTCLHVRNGDFDQVCQDIEHKKAPQWFMDIFAEGFKCKVTNADVYRALEGQKHALVLSPEPVPGLETHDGIVWGNEICDTVRLLYPARTAEDTQLLCAVLEQQACGDAASQVLSAFSTFSKRIGNLAQGKDVRWWRWLDEDGRSEAQVAELAAGKGPPAGRRRRRR